MVAKKYLDLATAVDFNSADVYYFQSINSKLDKQQGNHINDIKAIHKIRFCTSHHGIPFLKVAIPKVFAMSKAQLNKFETKINSPILFSIGRVGICHAIIGYYQQYKASKSKRK